MGGCATKPRELKTEAEAPVPLEVQRTAADTKAGAAGEEKDELQQGGERTEKVAEEGSARGTEEDAQPEEKRRRSLGLLFREDEEINVSSEEDNVVVKETIASSSIEAEDAVQQPKTGEHPEESVRRTQESGTFNTTQEEASAPSDSATSQAIVQDDKQVDLDPKEEDLSVVKEVVDLSTDVRQIDLEVTGKRAESADKEPASSNVEIA